MNLSRRIRIMRTIFWISCLQSRAMWLLIGCPLITVGNLTINLFQARAKRFDVLKEAVERFSERSASFVSKLQAAPFAVGDRKQELLATRMGLLAESERLQVLVSKLPSERPLGAQVLASLVTGVLTSVGSKLATHQHKSESFLKLVQAIDSDTLYWNLLVWLVVPICNIDSLLGDLSEEYKLRILSEGEASAREWYRKQVMATVGAYIWRRFERLMAVGSLVDWIVRWFRK